MLLLTVGLCCYCCCRCTGAQSGTETIVPAQSAQYTKPTSAYQIDCPAGSFVTGFTVTQDFSVIQGADPPQFDIFITSLWPLKCSNGESKDIPAMLKKLPNSRSSNDDRPAGYTAITLHTGEVVNGVSLQTAGTWPSRPMFGSDGESGTHVVTRPNGQVITGIYGQASDTHVISVGLTAASRSEGGSVSCNRDAAGQRACWLFCCLGSHDLISRISLGLGT